jgi:tRNA (guanine-N7-)-methyltransferase
MSQDPVAPDLGARRRPTPQPVSGEGAPVGPRFTDRDPEDFANPDANPYLVSHRTFGHPLLTADAAWKHKGAWAALFGREGPLHLEIGCGNGFFFAELARRNPDWNLVGIELRYKRTVLVAKKLVTAGISNAVIARYHAAYLDDLFEDGSLAGIYVNHPDPWPKERHEKNRLISRWFLEDVARLLQPGGWFRLKSDHKPNIDRVEALLAMGPEGEPLPRLPLTVHGRADDVTTGPAPWPDDIETNYQRKFRLRGEPVYALELRREP